MSQEIHLVNFERSARRKNSIILLRAPKSMALFGSAEGDISSQDISRLLLNAEQRLKASATIKSSPNHVYKLANCSKIPQKVVPKASSKLEPEKITKPYVAFIGGVARAEQSLLLTRHKQLWEQSVPQENITMYKSKSTKGKMADAGSDWFHLPRTNLTPIMKRELQILKMRSVLDPKRHYKRDDSKALASDYSQVGTIIQGPTEFFNSRLLNSDQKRTIASEILAMEESTGRFRSKYDKLQIAKASGKKSFYKKLKDKRSVNVKKR